MVDLPRWRIRRKLAGSQEIKDKYDNEILERIGIQARYRDKDLTIHFADLPFTFEPDDSYFITGPVGSGKTSLMAAMIRERALSLWDERECIFTSAEELLDQIRESYETKRDSELTYTVMMERYKKIEILAIDDLGTDRPTEWAVGKLYQIINHRYGDMLPTYFTSNLGYEDITPNLSDRLVSRIRHMCQLVVLDGSDRRSEG